MLYPAELRALIFGTSLYRARCELFKPSCRFVTVKSRCGIRCGGWLRVCTPTRRGGDDGQAKSTIFGSKQQHADACWLGPVEGMGPEGFEPPTKRL